jgi:rhamnosyltransferase
VCAVVVTYFPEWGRLNALLASLRDQVANVVVVDNSSDVVVVKSLHEVSATGMLAELILCETNVGIGGAQNRGIDAAQRLNSTHVLLMDQDSVASSTMVACLIEAAAKLEGEGVRVACVGPSTAGELARGARPREVPMIIASGALISISTLRVVGHMDASLFMDQVDTEWCLRARSLGYRCFLTDAVMDHRLGDDTSTFWFGRVRRMSIHSPERHYFNMRNSVALYRRSYVSHSYAVRDAARLAKLFVYFAAVGHPRRRHTRLMIKGVRDGWRGQTGSPFTDGLGDDESLP